MLGMKIIKEKENPVLKRTDIVLMLEHKGEATPKKDDILNMIVDKFKGDPKKTEVVCMFSEPGIARTKVKAYVWKEKVIEKPKKKEEGEGAQTGETQEQPKSE